jgi:hypothetical protein
MNYRKRYSEHMIICLQLETNQFQILITKQSTKGHLKLVFNTSSRPAPIKEGEDFLRLENHVLLNFEKIYSAQERRRQIRNLNLHQVFNNKIHKI